MSDCIPSLFMDEVEWVGMDRDRPGRMSYSFVTFDTSSGAFKARQYREIFTFGMIPARPRRVYIVFNHEVDRKSLTRQWARLPRRPSALRLPAGHEFAMFGKFEGDGVDDYKYLVAVRHIEARRRNPPDNDVVDLPGHV